MVFLFGRWFLFGMYNPVTDEVILPNDAEPDVLKEFQKHELQHKKDRKFGLLCVALGILTVILAGVNIFAPSLSSGVLVLGCSIPSLIVAMSMHIRATRAQKQL